MGDIPIGFEVQNYLDHENELTGLGPFSLYAFVVDAQIANYDRKVEQLASITSPEVIDKMLMFSSHNNLLRKLNQGEGTQYTPAQLQTMGITSVFYNSERGLSPADEMDHLLDTNPDTNSVVIFTRIAKGHGFNVGWGPIAHTAYTASDEVLNIVFEAGLDRIGIQEQKRIDDYCAAELAQTVTDVRDKYERIAGRPVTVGSQIMPGYQYTEGCYPGDDYARTNCADEQINLVYDHCKIFSQYLTDDGITPVSIWASAQSERQQLVPLIQALRR